MKKLSVDIVIPVYNEEVALPANLPILINYCQNNLRNYSWKIIIADNASTDTTPVIAKKFTKMSNIFYYRLKEKGRGRALREIWLKSKSDVVSYMDVDLSSNLNFFPSLLIAIQNGSDIAIGSRLSVGSRVIGRTILREFMSRNLNLLIKLFFQTSFHDAQCGFKALKRSVFNRLSPLIKNRNWFFDSELLIIAYKAGFKITEIPIAWHDDPSSTVKVAKTVTEDFKGLLRLRRKEPWKNLTK